MRKFFFSSLLLAVLAACSHSPIDTLVGADRDEHGCIGSAGYTWSYALHDCVRTWEVGERFDGPSKSIYLVYSDDSLFAEVFTQDGKQVLCKRQKRKPNTWLSKSKRESVVINNGITLVKINNFSYTKSLRKE